MRILALISILLFCNVTFAEEDPSSYTPQPPGLAPTPADPEFDNWPARPEVELWPEPLDESQFMSEPDLPIETGGNQTGFQQ